MTNEELIAKATSVINSKKIGDFLSGDVGCAVLSIEGNVFTGICIDTMSSMGFCAEHNAIGSMMTAGEYGIKKIVAVWKNEKDEVHVLHPCGRCREFMRQVNGKNMDIEVVVANDKVVTLNELLPYGSDFVKV